jgi:hypothetical protein
MRDGEPPGARLNDNEPETVAQFYDGEHEARFELDWKGIGERVNGA